MAVTKILARHARLDLAINYAVNPDKTDEEVLTAYLNCDKGHACHQMLATKEAKNNCDGVQYYHIIQSFKPGEITPELALEIAQAFAKEHLADYEVVIGVHGDKVLFAGIQDKEQPDAPIDLVIPTTDLELANVIFERLFGSLEKPQEERSPKKESRSERSSVDTGSSSPTSRKNSKNDRPSVGEQLQSFREKLSGVEPRVPTRGKTHSEITK